MHRELFEDEAPKHVEPFSISRNLTQRKHEQSAAATTNNSLKIDKMFAINAKGIDSITLASVSTEKFNDFAPANAVNKTTTSSSFLASLKSFFKCSRSVSAAASEKINEQTQLNYPLNLHLRMNQIFSMHDKLCDIAECLNDLYSVGMFDWLW